MEQEDILDLQKVTSFNRPQETLKATTLASGSATHVGERQPAKEELNLSHLPRDVLEHLAKHFTQMQDLIVFASTCRAAHSLVSSRGWPSVKTLQLLHSHPSAGQLKLWLDRCSNITEFDAVGCGQLSNDLLFLLADFSLKVVKLNGCWKLNGIEAQSAVIKLAAAGCLEVLDVRNTSIDINTDVMELLSISPNLRELCGRTLQGEWHGNPEESFAKDLFWPSLKHLHFTTAYLEHQAIQPWKLTSLVFDECPISSAISTLFFPALTEVAIRRSLIDLQDLNNLGELCPNLLKLDLSGCTIFSEEVSAIAKGRAASCARLRHLVLRDLYHPSSDALNRLLTSLAKPLSVKTRAGREQVPGFIWDFSGCSNIDDASFAGYAKNFKKWRSKGLPVHGIQQLRLANCWQISHELLHQLASGGSLDQLQVLDLANVGKLARWQLGAGEKTPEEVAQVISALCSTISAAGRSLLELKIDAAAVNDELCAAIGRCCSRLESLSLMDCYRVTPAGWRALSQGCTSLKSLAVGGYSLNWWDWIAFTAFTGLKELTIRSPGFEPDIFLIEVLKQHPQLEKFKLGMSKDVTDRAIEALPVESLRELTLDNCSAIRGHFIMRLTRLESLRLPNCDCITKEAVAAILVSCGRLRLLELPRNVSSEPFATVGREIGLRVEGGMQNVQ